MKNHMKSGILLCAILLIAAAGSVLPQSASLLPASLRFPEGVSRVTIPLEIFENVPYVPVRIPSLDRDLRFILDTGAGNLIVLEEETARAAKLVLGQGISVGGAGEGELFGYRVEGGRITAAGLEFEGGPMLTLPLGRLDPFWGKRKDGLLGGPWISQAVADIDYAAGSLTMSRREAFSWPKKAHTIPLRVEGRHPFVNVKVHVHGLNDPVETIMMVDTGLRVTSFSGPFWKAHDLAGHSPSRLETVTGFGIGGISRGILGRVRGLEIGDIFIREPVTDFSKDEKGALAGPELGGILGADILYRFRVILDYGGGRLGLVENKSIEDPYEWDMSGIWFRCEGPDFRTFVVHHVAPGTPAERAGLASGDRILTVDGTDARSFTLESLRRLLKRPGRRVALSIDRGGRTFRKSLALERIV